MQSLQRVQRRSSFKARCNRERCESVSGAQEQPAMHIETEVKLDFKVRARRAGGRAGARRARCTMPCPVRYALA